MDPKYHGFATLQYRTYRVELGKGSGFPDLEVAPRCGQVTGLHSLTSASMKKNYKQILLKNYINLHDFTLKHPFLQRKNELLRYRNTVKNYKDQKYGKREDKNQSC